LELGLEEEIGGQAGEKCCDTACGKREDKMDDEDYQRIADYESEMYELDRGQSQDGQQGSTPSKSVPDLLSSEANDDDDGNSNDSRKISERPNGRVDPPQANGAKQRTQPNTEHPMGTENNNSSDLSEDERDEIYARLYHGTNTLPTTKPVAEKAKANSEKGTRKSKKSKTKSQNGTTDFCKEFAFDLDLDLDSLPPPPEPIPEVTTLDSDGDFSVPSQSLSILFLCTPFFIPPFQHTPYPHLMPSGNAFLMH
jgi:hypothetical protein